jgi:superfamily II DNA/RNA helicase
VKGEGDDSKKVNRKESIRNAFNSPMRPFVLATTSIGQEGLDFHNYCRKIMHWNLPSNPVDLEQREGRINRYKCLAIRQNIAENYGSILFAKDIWNEMFTKAIESEKKENSSDLIPFWCLGENQKVKIERIVPMYPMSKDDINYERLIKILSMYRLTLGQARQEELLKYIFSNFDNSENLKELFIDLSPFSKEKVVKNNVNIEFSRGI